MLGTYKKVGSGWYRCMNGRLIRVPRQQPRSGGLLGLFEILSTFEDNFREERERERLREAQRSSEKREKERGSEKLREERERES